MQFATSLATRDKARPETAAEKKSFAYSRRAESLFGVALRSVARQVGQIVSTIAPEPGDTARAAELQSALGRYADAVRPWAAASAARMLADVSRRDESVWASLSKSMGRDLRREISTAPIGPALREAHARAVDLIQSLPLEAARRVHDLTIEGLATSARAAEVAADIRRTGKVTVGRANLIARTETARTSSLLVETRARHVGSPGYIWRTAKDENVRNRDGDPVGSHRLLEGRFIPWSTPPVASKSGERAHAGQIYNCRCYPEPVFSAEWQDRQAA